MKIIEQKIVKYLCAASNVCVTWKKFFHDFTSRRISNVDSVLRDKLVKCGWILSEHDVERCRCIELYTSLFKFIGNVPMSCRKLLSETRSNHGHMPLYAISQSKLIFSYDIDVVKVFNLMQEKMKPIEYNWSKRVNWIFCMQVHDKTLALVEEGYQEEDYGIYRVCIWNPETSQFIRRFNPLKPRR